jgi:predicted nucleic acid-binding protein
MISAHGRASASATAPCSIGSGLREGVRGWDAFYVALAEALDAPLLTLDPRLRRAHGPRCAIEVVDIDR